MIILITIAYHVSHKYTNHIEFIMDFPEIRGLCYKFFNLKGHYFSQLSIIPMVG